MTDREISDLITGVGGYGLGKALDGLVGNDISNWFESLKKGSGERVKNTVDILKRRRLKAEKQGITVMPDVPTRIAERIVNEGSYCTEEVMQEYYAGVLLSAHESSIDDEGIFYLSTIHRLSSSQLRAHYVLYQIIKEAYDGNGPASRLINFDVLAGLTYIRANDMMISLFGEDKIDIDRFTLNTQVNEYELQTEHILQGLRRENLVRCFFVTVDAEAGTLVGYSPFRHNSTPGGRRQCFYFFAPTLEGMKLFLWGQGYGKLPLSKFLQKEVVCPRFDEIHLEGFAPYDNQALIFDHTDIHELAEKKFSR